MPQSDSDRIAALERMVATLARRLDDSGIAQRRVELAAGAPQKRDADECEGKVGNIVISSIPGRVPHTWQVLLVSPDDCLTLGDIGDCDSSSSSSSSSPSSSSSAPSSSSSSGPPPGDCTYCTGTDLTGTQVGVFTGRFGSSAGPSGAFYGYQPGGAIMWGDYIGSGCQWQVTNEQPFPAPTGKTQTWIYTKINSTTMNCSLYDGETSALIGTWSGTIGSTCCPDAVDLAKTFGDAGVPSSLTVHSQGGACGDG